MGWVLIDVSSNVQMNRWTWFFLKIFWRSAKNKISQSVHKKPRPADSPGLSSFWCLRLVHTICRLQSGANCSLWFLGSFNGATHRTIDDKNAHRQTTRHMLYYIISYFEKYCATHQGKRVSEIQSIRVELCDLTDDVAGNQLLYSRAKRVNE